MMRFVTFSIAGSFVAAVLLMAPSQSIAQNNKAVEKTESTVKKPFQFSPGTERTIKAEQALKQTVNLSFDEAPYGDIEQILEEKTGLNFLLSSSAEDDSLTSDEPISFQIKDVSLGKALSLMLAKWNATYVIDNGVVIVISLDDADDTRWFRLKMYDCRELVKALPKSNEAGRMAIPRTGGVGFGGGAGGGGVFAVPQGPSAPAASDAQLKDASALLDKKLNKILSLMRADFERNRPEPTGELTLVNLVQSMVAPDSWQDTGQGLGVIDSVNGILVVTQSEQIQQEIGKFVTDLEASVLRRTKIEAVNDGSGDAPGKGATPPKNEKQKLAPTIKLGNASPNPFVPSQVDDESDPFK